MLLKKLVIIKMTKQNKIVVKTQKRRFDFAKFAVSTITLEDSDLHWNASKWGLMNPVCRGSNFAGHKNEYLHAFTKYKQRYFFLGQEIATKCLFQFSITIGNNEMKCARLALL